MADKLDSLLCTQMCRIVISYHYMCDPHRLSFETPCQLSKTTVLFADAEAARDLRLGAPVVFHRLGSGYGPQPAACDHAAWEGSGALARSAGRLAGVRGYVPSPPGTVVGCGARSPVNQARCTLIRCHCAHI